MTAPSALQPGQPPQRLPVRGLSAIAPSPTLLAAGFSPAGRPRKSRLFPAPSIKTRWPVDRRSQAPTGSGAQSLACLAAETRLHAGRVPVTSAATRPVPDSPARRWGRVSGRQVSPRETGCLGAPR